MSRGQLARTPAHFPRMKYRARKRNAIKDFEAAMAHLILAIPEFRDRLLTAIEDAVTQLRTILGITEDGQAALCEAVRRPWFEYLEQAEACGAKGSTTIGYGQCPCSACEKADDEVLKQTPIDEIMRGHQTEQEGTGIQVEFPDPAEGCEDCGTTVGDHPSYCRYQDHDLPDDEVAAIMAAEADPDFGKDLDDE